MIIFKRIPWLLWGDHTVAGTGKRDVLRTRWEAEEDIQARSSFGWWQWRRETSAFRMNLESEKLFGLDVEG